MKTKGIRLSLRQAWLTLLTVSAVVMLAPPMVRADGTDTTKADSVSDTAHPASKITSVEDLLNNLGVVHGASAAQAYDIYGFTVDMRLRWDSAPGPVGLILTVWNRPSNECTSFEAVIAKHDGLQVLSPLSQGFELLPGDTQVVEVEIDVPANDTSRIQIEVRCGQPVLIKQATFIADSVTAQCRGTWIFDRAPRPGGVTMSPRERRKAELDSIHPIGTFSLGMDGEYYNSDSLPPDFEPWDPKAEQSRRREERLAARDSVEQERQRQRIEERLKDLQERESEPCTVGSERFVIDGQAYTRKEGETKYRQPQGVTDIPAYIDSVFRNRASEEPLKSHVVVDLSDPNDSAFVQGLVDSLIPFDSGHLYHTEVDRAAVLELEQSVVPWNYYPLRPGEQLNVPRRAPGPPGGDTGDDKLRGWTTIFEDGFEGSWPGAWQAQLGHTESL